jgi:hypothetical protein
MEELWISDSGINQVEFFYNIFWVDRTLYALTWLYAICQ